MHFDRGREEFLQKGKFENMKPITRSDFVRKSTVMAGGAFVAPAYIRGMISDSPNGRVNVALIGIAGLIWGFFYIPETKGKSLEYIEEQMRAGKSPREI